MNRGRDVGVELAVERLGAPRRRSRARPRRAARPGPAVAGPGRRAPRAGRGPVPPTTIGRRPSARSWSISACARVAKRPALNSPSPRRSRPAGARAASAPAASRPRSASRAPDRPGSRRRRRRPASSPRSRRRSADGDRDRRLPDPGRAEDRENLVRGCGNGLIQAVFSRCAAGMPGDVAGGRRDCAAMRY